MNMVHRQTHVDKNAHIHNKHIFFNFKKFLKGILEQALVVAKIKNKARYTPKKYRQDND